MDTNAKGSVSPPTDIAELCARARALDGCPLGDLAHRLGTSDPSGGRHQKGRVGELLEAVLGATGGPGAVLDFPALGVELKTIPVNAGYVPRESTFVCAISLVDAETATWESAWVREKLSCVLWVPIVGDASVAVAQRRIGRPLLWRPSAEEERVLQDDFEELMGTIGAGGIEAVTAYMGVALQVRPKAATGRVRTTAFGPEGERIPTVPRGFYLRTSFTAAIIQPLG